ncbi:MAG: lysylphosphatidylglycerol synthase transmembrane domain-containing protein [bacterium]|nr:lysylphosphatidylglycerol synthase transmembrane domain-containing protein [bacterium]
MSRRQQIAVVLGLSVSVIFLAFAFRNLQPQTVLETMGQVNVLWLLVGAVVYFGAVALISLRWQFLLRAMKLVPLTSLIPLVSIGYMGNNVYPFRSGEALRIYLLQRNHRIPIVRATTTVLVERVFDGLVMLTFILVPLALLEIASSEIRAVATFAAPIFLAALAVFFALALRPDLLRQLVRLLNRFLPGKIGDLVQKLGEEIIGGLEGLRSPAQLAGAVISSYASWSVEALVYWIVAGAFGLDLSYIAILLVVGTVNLAGLIPASPGQIGVYEFFVSLVLVALGVEETTALGYALVVHLVIWLPVTLVGFYFLARQGLNFTAIAQAREIEEQAAEKAADPVAMNQR